LYFDITLLFKPVPSHADEITLLTVYLDPVEPYGYVNNKGEVVGLIHEFKIVPWKRN